jgi:hypothetical protein
LEPRVALDAGGVEPGALGDLSARFFLSTAGLGDSPVAENPVIRLQPGETTQLHLWAQIAPGKRFVTASFDIVSTESDIVHATGATMYNPAIDEGLSRWELDDSYPGGFVHSHRALGQLITGWTAVGLTSRGLRIDGLSHLDETYDAESGAVLVGTLDITADAAGVAELYLATGIEKTVTHPQDRSLRLGYGFGDGGFGDGDVSGYVVGDMSPLADATIIVGEPEAVLSTSTDRYAVAWNSALDVDAEQGVLANDLGGNDRLQAILVTGPEHGQLTLRPDGGFTYTPNTYFAADHFTYVASDGVRESGATRAVIEALPVVSVLRSLSALEPDEGSSFVELSVPVTYLARTVSVDFATVDGTARAADGDYEPVSGTLTVRPGEAGRIRVPIRGDGALEPGESFFVRFTNAVNAVFFIDEVRIDIGANGGVGSGVASPLPGESSPRPLAAARRGLTPGSVDEHHGGQTAPSEPLRAVRRSAGLSLRAGRQRNL